jgi:putative toxin-antitoxin system antitoxin component (TIGR02293 family)
LAIIIRHMAEKTIPSESLGQALRFLEVKKTPSKSGHLSLKTPKVGGHVTVKVRKLPTKKAPPTKASKILGGSVTSRVKLKSDAIDRLAYKLDVPEFVILDVSGISERTFHRRQQQGEPLTSEEADRILRIARVAGEAERIFGDTEKSRRWLASQNALLGATPLSLLATDAGSRDVEAELMRIDWGDFV